MVDAAREALLHVLNLRPEERVLVVTDEGCHKIGSAFSEAAKEIGTPIEMYILPETKRPLKEPPPETLDLLEQSDVVINAFKAINDEIPFRITWIKEFSAADDMAGVIGELGIGINPKARLTGNLLEDEKAYRTAHIAFGNNEEMPGGQNTSKVHRDYLFHNPTFTITYGDGSQRVVMKDGIIQV